MKPRNKREREVVELSSKMLPITETQKQYAYKHCFVPTGVVLKKGGAVHCLECGVAFYCDTLAGEIVCPNCNNELDIRSSRKRKPRTEKEAYQVVTTAGGWQVIRTYYAHKTTAPEQPAQYNIYEVARLFIKPNTKEVVLARPRLMSYSALYDLSKPMSIKDENYHICADVIYPRWKVLPILKRNGFCKELKQGVPNNVFRALLYESQYETLAKAKRFDFFFKLRGYVITNYWPQVKMAIRHNYYPSDYRLWEDTIVMAKNNGCDIFSPKYVLPDNLQQMHDEMVRKQTRREKAEAVERRKKDNENYVLHYGELLSVEIEGNGITIAPLKSYEEFYEEGKAMHHCVESYFDNKDSLILSAKKNGERIATIELSMDNFAILQCRAHCNKQPEEYDNICNLINNNVKLLKEKKYETI